jgi:cysteine desulfurase/selenocysteine lyase
MYRHLFPVTERYAYLNHAGLSPVATPVVERVHSSVLSQAQHGLARITEWEQGVERVRGISARLLGCQPAEIAFVRNTSHGLSLVAQGLDWREGDNVLCAVSEEYPSNIYPWQRLASRGVQLRAVPAPEVDAFAAAGDGRTRILAVSSVQYASGLRVDLAALGQLCAERGWLLCVDGIQSVGALPTDVKRDGVHFLSADSHKWMLGLPGVGLLYVDAALAPRLEPALIGWRSTQDAFNFDRADLTLRTDATRFEEGNLQYALIEGMGAAIDLLLEVGLPRIWEEISGLGDELMGRLSAGGHLVDSPTEPHRRSGSVVFRPRAGDAAELVQRLEADGVIVSCRRGRVRVSPHFYNTAEEIRRVAQAAG